MDGTSCPDGIKPSSLARGVAGRGRSVVKGTVLVCLKEVVVSAASEAVWHQCLVDAGFPPFQIFSLSENVDEDRTRALIEAVCARLGVTLPQAGDAFGAHWVGTYSPRIYKHFYARSRNAREFFTNLNEMHTRVTQAMPGAKPPVFDLTWTDPDTLVMTYRSTRGMIDIAVGMARGIGVHYGEPLEVEKLDPTRLRIRFVTSLRPRGTSGRAPGVGAL
ncbi:MAG: hypothetical protein EOO75_21400 [Myxococcales bacterium]|nr:MAG: hypothetical protein EOO75_21400 [Myxococcales bacterium]